MKGLKLMTVTAMAVVSLPLFAQKNNPYDGVIKYENINISHNRNGVSLKGTAQISDLNLNSKQMLIVTPMLVSKDKQHTAIFPRIILTGRNRTKALARELHFGTAMPEAKEAKADGQIIRRFNGKAQEFMINSEIPYENWMQTASLVVNERSAGCGQCPLGESLVSLLTNPFFDPTTAAYTFELLTPSEEIPKNRVLSFKSYINFEWDKAAIKKEIAQNATELARVDKFIDEVKANTDNIRSMKIYGWTSPEGTVAYNAVLSEKRAKALADYLTSKYGKELPSLELKAMGEDWKTLREVVEAGTKLGDAKTKILAILDAKTYKNEDERENALRKLGDVVYYDLFRNYYPASRRDDIAVDASVRAYTLEESVAMVFKHPEYMSEAEITRAANNFAVGSVERTQIHSIAVKTYPNSVPLRTNAAIDAVQNKKYETALALLEPISSKTPKIIGLLGVVYARMGQLEKAEQLLQQAAEAGDATAQSNLALFRGEGNK